MVPITLGKRNSYIMLMLCPHTIVEKLGYRDIQQRSIPSKWIPNEGEEESKCCGYLLLTATYG